MEINVIWNDENREQVIKAEARKTINEVVRNYAVAHGNCFASAYCKLYKKFEEETGLNLFKTSKQEGCKPLDSADRHNVLLSLAYIAEDLFDEEIAA